MEEEKLNKTWSEVISLVKTYEGIDPSQVNAFFSRLQPQAHSEGFLVITADNEFIRSWVEHNYAAHIKRALEEIDGVPTSILVAVDPNQPAPMSSGPAPASTYEAQNQARADGSAASPRADIAHVESYIGTASSTDVRSREHSVVESLPSDAQSYDDDIIDPIEADGLASMPGGTTVEMQRFGNGVRAEDTPTSHLKTTLSGTQTAWHTPWRSPLQKPQGNRSSIHCSSTGAADVGKRTFCVQSKTISSRRSLTCKRITSTLLNC